MLSISRREERVMKRTSLSDLDFNLLKVLKVLAEERNTRRAAEKLCITQPSVSYALKRLREVFDDELFVRTQYGLTPTIKGEQLIQQLPVVFHSLEELFEGSGTFIPADYSGEIRIVLNSFLNQAISLGIYKIFRTLAPNATVQITSWSASTENDLKTGVLQLGINYTPMQLSKEIRQIPFVEDDFVICCRKNHHLANTIPTIKALSSYPLVVFLAPEMNTIKSYAEQVLLRAGHQPDVLLRTDVLDSAFDVVSETDALLALPMSCLKKAPNSLTSIDVSKEISMPSGKVAFYLLNQNRTSQYYQWVMETVSSLVKEQISF